MSRAASRTPQAPQKTAGGPRWQVLGRPPPLRPSEGCPAVEDAAKSTSGESYCERLTGTTRRECLDFLIPRSEEHLHRLLTEWRDYYNRARPHSSLGPRLPTPSVELPMKPDQHRHQLPYQRAVASRPVLGGLHHDYRLSRVACLTDLVSRGEQRVLSRARYCVGGLAATACRISTASKTSSQNVALMAVCPSIRDLLFCGSQLFIVN